MGNSSQSEVTKVIQGLINTTDTIRRFQSNAMTRISSCLSAFGPSVAVGVDTYKKGLIEAGQRGVELRFVIEVTKENIPHCKELTKIAEVRHLDGIRGNFEVTEGEYIATTVLQEGNFWTRLIYSNVKEVIELQQNIFELLWDKAISASQKIKEIEEAEKTEVIYGKENVVKAILTWQHASEKYWNLCLDSSIPAFSMSEQIRKGYLDAKARGVKIRYITEITEDNLKYCKEIMNFAQVRHLNGLIGNFVVSEKEYLGEASIKEFLTHLIYSNRKEIVNQQNYIFENLWNNGIHAEKRVKMIEEGTTPVETKILEDPQEIHDKIRTEILDSNEIRACSHLGRIQFIYNEFFDFYREVLDRQRRGQHRGIRLIVTVDKDVLDLVKKFVEAGVQVRHMKNLLPLSFVLTDKEIQANLEDIKGRKMLQSLLTTNEPGYMSQFATVFDQLWKDGIDAKIRIKDMEEGNDNEIEVIQNPARALELYINALKAAKDEILLIFPTTSAIVRQAKLGIIEHLRSATEAHGVQARLLMPAASRTGLAGNDLTNQENKNIDIRYIETISGRATVLVVDKRISLVMELKDDSKDNFFDAIGLSTYSNSKGSVLSHVAMFENLWTQTEVMTKLKIHDKMQEEFMSIAAHELRTPIQPILSLTASLRSDVTTTGGQEMLDIVIRNAERLQQLAEDLLDVARIEGKVFHLNIETFDLGELIIGIISDCKKVISHTNKDIKLSVISNSTDIFVQADKARITQVISNLMNNAIRFTTGGSVCLTAEKKGNEVMISVRDSGPGIDPEIIPRLFTKFATKSMTGTGLGLFISKNIVELHRGRIVAENNAEGKGATIKFTLPLG